MNTEEKYDIASQYARVDGEVVLRDHVYDGIQEYDQKLPNWWLYTLYAAIVWFVVYWTIYYHTKNFKTDGEKVMAAMNRIEDIKSKELEGTLAKLDNQTLIERWSTDLNIVNNGRSTYTTNCVACHAADLSATLSAGDQKIPLPGLALNDGNWKYGAEPMAIFRLIHDGTPPESSGHNGARMSPWSQQLSPKQIAEVTAYLISENRKDFAALAP